MKLSMTMTKSKSFLQHFMKTFISTSNQGNEEDDLERIAAREQKHFSFDTLVEATKNFHPDSKLGEGGFGPVFKGKLDDGREIAVKKLSQSSLQPKKEFLNEAKLLARVQHRNVVNLLGYCVHGVEKLLVYEYVVNESLDKHLFKTEGGDKLDWKSRHDIIKGISKGVSYLHEDAHTCIIHRHIKASNILLDEKWVPKIADFGMAHLYPEDQTYVNTRVVGTNGYMALEYVMHGRLSVKADVFSFGVIVLELISGQKNSNFDRDPQCRNLLEWAYNLYKKGKSLEIMESALVSSAIPDEVQLCVHIGLLCTQADPQLRPDMRRVVLTLAKKPASLEEPTRPGYPGTRYRRSRQRPGSVSSTSETSGDFYSHSTGSTNGTAIGIASASTSAVAHQLSDPHGKRPIEG